MNDALTAYSRELQADKKRGLSLSKGSSAEHYGSLGSLKLFAPMRKAWMESGRHGWSQDVMYGLNLTDCYTIVSQKK